MHPELDGVELKKIPPPSPGLPSPRPVEADSAIAALCFAFLFSSGFFPPPPPPPLLFAFFFSRDLFFGNEIFALLTLRTQGLASPEQTGPPQQPSTPAGRRGEACSIPRACFLGLGLSTFLDS